MGATVVDVPLDGHDGDVPVGGTYSDDIGTREYGGLELDRIIGLRSGSIEKRAIRIGCRECHGGRDTT